MKNTAPNSIFQLVIKLSDERNHSSYTFFSTLVKQTLIDLRLNDGDIVNREHYRIVCGAFVRQDGRADELSLGLL